MSRAGSSTRTFGIYLVIIGMVFTLPPNTLLAAVNLHATGEVWIRPVGMLLIILACYLIMAWRTDQNHV